MIYIYFFKVAAPGELRTEFKSQLQCMTTRFINVSSCKWQKSQPLIEHDVELVT